MQQLQNDFDAADQDIQLRMLQRASELVNQWQQIESTSRTRNRGSAGSATTIHEFIRECDQAKRANVSGHPYALASQIQEAYIMASTASTASATANALGQMPSS